MNINVEHQSNCRAVVHVHATAEEVAKHRSSLVAYYTRGAKLPGYRPGKVPAAVILKTYGAAITEELERQLASDGLQTAIKNEGLDVLSILGVTDKLHHDTDKSFTCNIELSLTPKFELPNYKGIAVKLPRVEVNDADIDHDLLHLRERYQTFEDVSRAAGIKDVVVLGYEAYLDAQPVAEVMPDAPDHLKSLEQQWFLLDEEDDFLPGFYAGLVGISANEQRNLDISLPEDFAFEALRGKTLQFQTTCGGVKEKRVPDLDDEFIKKVGGEEMTLETLRNEVAEGLRRRREQARDVSKTNQVLEHLSNNLEFELPQEVVNRAAQRRTNEIAQNALRQGVNEAELVNQQEAILNTATQQARQNVKISFILSEVARAENLSVADAQVQMALAQMAARSGMPVKKYLAQAQKEGVINSLRDDLLLQNAIEFLKDQAVIEETEPEAEHCETHSPADA
jgi:trigger factor